MAACNEIIPSFMKSARGEKDVQTSLVAGFGYGVMISLVTGMRGPTSIMSVGVTCELVNVGRFKVIMSSSAYIKGHMCRSCLENKQKGHVS
ncbi:putative mitochondrial import inner membrane translocase subunit TIM22 [Helianthus anomalus]